MLGPIFDRLPKLPYDPCDLETEIVFGFSSKDNSLNMRSSDKNASKMLKTGSEVRPWISLDLGEKKKLKKILLKPELPEGELRSYLVSYSTYKPIDSTPRFMGYEGRTKLVYLNTEGYIELNDFDARYIQVKLNNVASESLTLSVSQVLVACEPPVVTEDGKCTNGGFETGDFTGWIAETGKWGFINGVEAPVFTRNGVEQGHHDIISLPLRDPLIPLSNPCSGKYVARLGSPGVPGGEAERLTYSFTVDNSNSNFYFRYAFVVEDGGHEASEQPFFQYRFYYIENGVQRTAQLLKKVASSDDPFFTNVGFRQFKSWSCVNLDLSPYIGKQMFAEFTNVDCAREAHMAYAYIDGLCTSSADNSPKAVIDGSDKVCADADYNFSGEASCGGDQYTWSLGKVWWKAGVQNEVKRDFIGQVGKINIRDFYNLQYGGTYPFELDNTYRLTLTLKNDCGFVTTVSKDIFISSRPNIDYKDIAVCSDYTGDIKMIPIENSCSNCTIRWSPSYAFTDFTSRYAVLKPLFVQCGSTVKVTITNPVGCSFSDDVKLYPLDNQFLTIEKDVDMSALPKSQYCYYDINLKVNGCLTPDRFKVSLRTDADPNYVKAGDLTSNSNNVSNFNFKIPQSLGENILNTSGNISIKLTPDFNLQVYGNCLSTTFNVENRFWYWGYFNSTNKFIKGNLPVNGQRSDLASTTDAGIFIPNRFAPLGNSPANRTFNAFPKPGSSMGAFWRRVEIFNGAIGNGRLSVIEELAPPPTISNNNKFSDNPWVMWDGLFYDASVNRLVPHAPKVYVWFINLENCVHSRNEPIQENWKGDINLAN